MKRNILWTLIILVVLLIIFGAIANRHRQGVGDGLILQPETEMPADPMVDTWSGRWVGPEGTVLTIEAGETTGYVLNFVMLDGPVSVVAVQTNEGLAFVRDNQSYVLRHGSGTDTGMKWLMDKQDCVVVQQSEGYCRD